MDQNHTHAPPDRSIQLVSTEPPSPPPDPAASGAGTSEASLDMGDDVTRYILIARWKLIVYIHIYAMKDSYAA